MKTIKISNLYFRVIFLGSILGMSLMFQSCATKMEFRNSSVVPAAEGTVKIKANKNNNYNIDLSVIRLADPSRLSPPKKFYMVWMNTAQNGVKEVGELNTSSSFLSQTMKSSLKTTVPFQPTGFFITAEDNPLTTNGTPGEIVLNTN